MWGAWVASQWPRLLNPCHAEHRVAALAREEPCPPAFSRVSQRLGASIVRHVMRLTCYKLVRA
jgi:hypothetical protein